MHTKPLRGIRSVAVVIAVVAASFALGPTPAAEEKLVTVSGHVIGCSGKHTVYIMLWDKTIFDSRKPVKKMTRQAKEVRSGRVGYSFKTKPGQYTVSAYEDEDGNRTLKVGLFGPKEPQGFYREYTGWGPPSFKDIKFSLTADLKNAHIKLK